MSDRELLEAAAKAAGFGDEKGRTTWTESEYPRGSGMHGALWNFAGHMDSAELWNPLTDDGDALRLAVALEIELGWYARAGYATARAVPMSGNVIRVEEFGSGPNAATRRAIVRAAAAIGKDMP